MEFLWHVREAWQMGKRSGEWRHRYHKQINKLMQSVLWSRKLEQIVWPIYLKVHHLFTFHLTKRAGIVWGFDKILYLHYKWYEGGGTSDSDRSKGANLYSPPRMFKANFTTTYSWLLVYEGRFLCYLTFTTNQFCIRFPWVLTLVPHRWFTLVLY